MMRAIEKLSSPTGTAGSRTPMLRNSTPNSTVASACSRNSTPPVTSSWLIGSAFSTGLITSWCIAAPSSATKAMPSAIASSSGMPCTECTQ